MLASRVANDRAAVPPITPATYIRLRREAAGKSQMAVARDLYAIKIKRPVGDKRPRRLFDSVDQALAMIQQLEVPGARAKYRPVIDVLGGVFPLDADVYHQLAEEPADCHPVVCPGCGCSLGDPCTGSEGICTMSLGTTCSRCIDDSAAGNLNTGRRLAA